MSTLNKTIADAFASEYSNRARELHRRVDPLSEEQFWRNPFVFGNSIGHLVLHLTGNLSYYVGAQIAGTGYVRNRDREFTESGRPSKAEVMRKFDNTIAMVVSTLGRQSESDWLAPYTAEREPESKDRFTLFLRCASHFYHHVGQINYISRELTK
ncbi:MAG: DinB family protein [Candidatus Acidiferrum sp.]